MARTVLQSRNPTTVLHRTRGVRCSPRIWSGLLIGATVALLIGCTARRPPCVSVRGVVTYHGRPLEGAGIRFVPKGSRSAAGVTDVQGRFTLLSFVAGDGAVLGEHVVCVSKWIPDSNDKQTDVAMKRHISVLPERYGTPEQSPLRAIVTAKGPNEFVFDLPDN